jgi:tRNA nucleotidyltransferase (CCA-adding enzyme)
MRNYLSRLPKNVFSIVKLIGWYAEKNQVPVYLVGGIVRDLLLNIGNLDLDIVVEGDAIKLARDFASLHNYQLTAYPQFGTASVWDRIGYRIDFASARKESYSSSGALPRVSPGTIQDDLFRRDFTINAMAIAINQKIFGQLIDLYDGKKDLSAGKIRILYNDSFIDDPTRMLRAIRFADRFNFHFEKNTNVCFEEALRKDVLNNVKPPRFFNEFKKNLNETDVVKEIKLLVSYKIHRYIDPTLKLNINDLKALQTALNKEKRLNQVPIKKWFIYLLEILHNLSEERSVQSLRRFQLSREEEDALRQSFHKERVLDCLSIKSLKSSQVYEILRPFCLSVVIYFYFSAKNKSIQDKMLRFIRRDSLLKLDINGDDLKDLGYKEGSEIKHALRSVLFKKIDGQLKGKKEELRFAKTLMKPSKLKGAI